MNGQAFACIRLDRQGAALSCFASSGFSFRACASSQSHAAENLRRDPCVFLQKENPAYRTAGFSSRPGLEGRHQRNLNAPSGRWFRGSAIAGSHRGWRPQQIQQGPKCWWVPRSIACRN